MMGLGIISRAARIRTTYKPNQRTYGLCPNLKDDGAE